MSNFSGTALTQNTPNYAGNLYTASPTETPFLSLIGGVGGTRAKLTHNYEFPTCSLYEHDAAEQPNISETESLKAPDAYTYVRTQEKNVTQIFHETISVSYVNESNRARLQGINTAGQQNNAPSELDFQTARTLEKVARNIEHTFLNGTYQNSGGSSSVPNRTRGMIESAGIQLDANGEQLEKMMLDDMMQAAWDNGATFTEFYLFTNGTQKRRVSDIYKIVPGFQLPATRNVGGLNIIRIETDFGGVNIVLDKFMPANVVLGADLSVIAPVEQPHPTKGNFFRESLGVQGAADEFQLFGQIGLDHGPGFKHFVIKDLSTALAPANTGSGGNP